MTPLNEQAYNYLQKLIMENHFPIRKSIPRQNYQKNWEFRAPR